MTIEEKAKRYDEAVSKLRGMMPNWERLSYNGKTFLQDLTYIFPELKEIEDERIFEEIYKDLHTYYMIQRDKFVLTDIKEIWDDKWSRAKAWLKKQGENNMGISEATKQELEYNLNKALQKETPESWNEFLEKQGEQKSVPKFKVGDTIAKKHNSDINNFGSFTITDITGGKYWYNDRIICDITEQDEWELVRQKPAWSEEDENTIKFLINHFCVSHCNRSFQFTSNKLITHDELLEKIRNLRPQNTWKPSDEQIKVCKEVYADILSAKGFYIGTVNSELNRLEEQLKKPREE